MIDEISAEQYMQTVEGLAIGKVPVEIDPEEGGNAVAVMKGNTDLLDWVNERIAAYEAEGPAGAVVPGSAGEGCFHGHRVSCRTSH